MLHEILFALLGKAGNIIKDYGDKFELDDQLDFINKSEKEIINSLCLIGFYYSRIEQFLDENHIYFSKGMKYMKQKGQDYEDNDGPIEEMTVIGNSAYLKVNLILKMMKFHKYD